RHAPPPPLRAKAKHARASRTYARASQITSRLVLLFYSALGVDLTTPLISDNPESLVEDRLFGEGSCELLDERLEPFLWHIWDQFVERAALAKQRVGACLAGVRLQVAIVAQRLACGPEQRQQRDGACVEQPQPIPPG